MLGGSRDGDIWAGARGDVRLQGLVGIHGHELLATVNREGADLEFVTGTVRMIGRCILPIELQERGGVVGNERVDYGFEFEVGLRLSWSRWF